MIAEGLLRADTLVWRICKYSSVMRTTISHTATSRLTGRLPIADRFLRMVLQVHGFKLSRYRLTRIQRDDVRGKWFTQGLSKRDQRLANTSADIGRGKLAASRVANYAVVKFYQRTDEQQLVIIDGMEPRRPDWAQQDGINSFRDSHQHLL